MIRTLLAGLLLLMPLLGHAIEEPDFTVVREIDGVQIREYAPYAVAEVVVPGPAEDAGSRAFPILAGYIFGKNKGSKKLDMTAPVTQTSAPVKLDMTAPVTQTAAADGFVVQFVLPRSVTLETAPEPIDPRVQLRTVPANRVAVVRFSGLWSASNYERHLEQLRVALRGAGITPTGEPIWSRYNPPITPWFLRRNEIWLPVP